MVHEYSSTFLLNSIKHLIYLIIMYKFGPLIMEGNSKKIDVERVAPVVQAHKYALVAEENEKNAQIQFAIRHYQLASEKFLEASRGITCSKTTRALKLLAESHSNRAEHLRSTYINHTANNKTQKPIKSSPHPKQQPNNENIDGEYFNANENNENIDGEYFNANEDFIAEEENKSPTEIKYSLDDRLVLAEKEMNELWNKLNDLGLDTTPLDLQKQAHVLSSSRHLSSSLGDSFCVLPTKGRGTSGLLAPVVDGGATLRAAAASRLRNTRASLIQKQQTATRSTQGNNYFKESTFDKSFTEGDTASNIIITNDEDFREGGCSHDTKQVEVIKYQKSEILRLLQTVKRLMIENTSLLKECDDKVKLQEENKFLKESMIKFKEKYNNRFSTLKGALEEWKRQKQNETAVLRSADSSLDRDDVLKLKNSLDEALSSNKRKDLQLQKYEQWYKSLKEGARAKQKSRHTSATRPSQVNPPETVAGSPPIPPPHLDPEN